MKVLKYIIRFVLGGELLLLAILAAPKENKEKIKEDVIAERNTYTFSALWNLICEKKRFRNVLYYRLQQSTASRTLSRVPRLLIRPLDTVEISGDIGGGLMIAHNYAVVAVRRAGRFLSVYQGVSIGQNGHGELATIGDHVIILPNASVFGNITIGDHVTIGAGSVVNKDVPGNVIVAGNPFRIIREIKQTV